MPPETQQDGSTETPAETLPEPLSKGQQIAAEESREFPIAPADPKPEGSERKSWGPTERQKYEKLAESVPPSGEVGVTLEDGKQVFIKARNRLGLNKKKWAFETVRAADQFGRFLGVKLTARVQLVNTIDSFEQVQKVFEVAGAMANDPALAADIRVKALAMVTEAAKVGALLSDQMMKLAESGKDGKDGMQKPKNAPPSFGVETTSGEGEKRVTTRVVVAPGQTA